MLVSQMIAKLIYQSKLLNWKEDERSLSNLSATNGQCNLNHSINAMPMTIGKNTHEKTEKATTKHK